MDEASHALAVSLAREDEQTPGRDVNLKFVRRSVRASGRSSLKSNKLNQLLEQIEGNHPEVQVLKLKNYTGPETNTWVMDKILAALLRNENCEVLYIQNFNDGMLDAQVAMLSKVLRRGHIWGLNIGENYRISSQAWDRFAAELKDTSVTHMYASEHVISAKLKTKFRDIIRDNRKKHHRHDSVGNLAVIMQVTNMWWNPIQGGKIRKHLEIQRSNGETPPPPPEEAGTGCDRCIDGTAVKRLKTWHRESPATPSRTLELKTTSPSPPRVPSADGVEVDEGKSKSSGSSEVGISAESREDGGANQRPQGVAGGVAVAAF